MKKIALCIGTCLTLVLQSQTIADFETFFLSPNSVYQSLTSIPFQTDNATFKYKWEPAFGGFWAGGFAYTNKYDSTNGTFNNLYGVKPFKGNNGSATYVVAQDRGVIKLKAPFKTVEGFYITNTTYAFKTVRNGNQFSRKFGDTTGTGSGTTIAQGSYPDFFKVTAKGYLGGTMKTDSAVFFLADYRFSNNTQDYIVSDWRWFNTQALGTVDSIRFFMYSSDANMFGMNTPAFFGMDDFTTSAPNTVGGVNHEFIEKASVFPNPFNGEITVLLNKTNGELVTFSVIDITGKTVYQEQSEMTFFSCELSRLNPGIYIISIEQKGEVTMQKVIKK